MLVFIDRCTGEDHFSDAFKYEEVFGGTVIKVPVKWGYFSDNEDVKLAGSNPSAEDGEEDQGGETKERKIDLVHQFKLTKCEYMNKKGFKEWLNEEDNKKRWKQYLVDALLEKDYKLSDEDALAQEVDGGLNKEWKMGLQEFVKFILPQWKNVEIYHDVKEDIEGAKIFYIGDEEGDHFYYIKSLYKTEKF